MARRRYYRGRRRSANYVWQPCVYSTRLTINTATKNAPASRNLFELRPGLGSTDTPDEVEAFTDDHVLERIVGSMAHDATGKSLGGTDPTWFPLTIAAVKVPVGFTSQTIDLFDNSQGDDFMFRMDAVCNALSTNESVPNWHAVNSKARRKFNVGDTIQWLLTFQPGFLDSSWNVEIALNLRLLWKLKN